MPNSAVESSSVSQEMRAECPILRTHRRFLLRQLGFTQQYASMYRCRMAAQQDRALAAIQRAVAAIDGADGDGTITGMAAPSDVLRVLEFKPNQPAFSVGVLFKQMKLLPKFLDEYQRELVRIDAGEDNEGEGGGGGDDDGDMTTVQGVDASSHNATEIDASPDADGLPREGQDRAAADEHYSVCHPQDELMLEDSSGRVTLQGLDATRFCTGVVIGIYGTLLASGQVMVHRYAFASSVECYVPRPLPPADRTTPCYVAFVCGLSVRLPDPVESVVSNTHTVAFMQHRALLELLVDFISGSTSDPELLEKSRHISRLVIGGNSIAPTDELRLKKKVKLDPTDHVRLNDDKTNAGVVTSAKLMRELDGVLERLAATVELELMPGENDMSDAFQPQQPLHPVLLPRAARYSTLRLVTNPFEFTALVEGGAADKEEELESEEETGKKDTVKQSAAKATASGGTSDVRGVSFFVTSGQNVNDVARETRFDTHLEAMGMLLASGCACPTAPNTLFSYPFRDEDPFLFTRTPHCLVACDQPAYETQFVALADLEAAAANYLAKIDGESDVKTDEERVPRAQPPVASGNVPGVRLVCVPSFERLGTLVLVDVNSPTLETTRITFAVRGEAPMAGR